MLWELFHIRSKKQVFGVECILDTSIGGYVTPETIAWFSNPLGLFKKIRQHLAPRNILKKLKNS